MVGSDTVVAMLDRSFSNTAHIALMNNRSGYLME